VPTFTSHEDVTCWLEGKPRDVAVVFAARAALRVIPVLASAFGLPDRILNQAQSDTVLRTFRCMAAAWAVAAYPGHVAELHAAAATGGAKSKVATASEEVATAREVEAAAAWASSAAGGGHVIEVVAFASYAVGYAIEAAAGRNREASRDVLNCCAADAEILDQEYSPVTLALSSTLWPSLPRWASIAWAHLKRALLNANEDWRVWTDWYDARLRGDAADQVLEVARPTIPDEVWDQGPKVVNARLKGWYIERGIWRYATADEPDVDPKLAGISVEEFTVIGARVALRAVPMLAGTDDIAAAAISMFRFVAVAWAAAQYATPLRDHALRASDYANKQTANTIVHAGVKAAAAAVAASMSEALARQVTGGVSATHEAAFQLDGRASQATFEMAMADDLRDLKGASATAIAQLPLWPGGTPPPWIAQEWDSLKRDLLVAGIGWETWINWYEDRLAGNVRPRPHEFAYVEVPDHLWPQGPATVNAWIATLIEGLQIPALPAPGPGPRFWIVDQGTIDRAPASDVDESGNDIRTINQLKPLVQRCASDLRARLSRNEFPELLTTVEQYDAALNPRASYAVEWGEVWGLGVMLQNAASSAERQIARRILPPLEDPAKSALDSLLSLHGPLILATADGAKLSTTAQSFTMTREQQGNFALRPNAWLNSLARVGM
jgi:hypothetical protein